MDGMILHLPWKEITNLNADMLAGWTQVKRDPQIHLWEEAYNRRAPIINRQSFLVSRVNPTEVPTSGVLRTWIACPCASIICLQMARPKPVPPLSRLLAESVR